MAEQKSARRKAVKAARSGPRRSPAKAVQAASESGARSEQLAANKRASDTALGNVLTAVKKRAKDDPAVAHLMSERVPLSEVTDWIPSAFAGLDHILGGGWAVGRASEVYGKEASGKSALSHLAIRECQRRGGFAVLLDFELSADLDKLKGLGVDLDRLVYVSPRHVEEGWEYVWDVHKQLKAKPPENPTLIVWDSVGGSVSKAQFEADETRREAGRDRANVMSTNCTKMFRSIAEVKAHMMWINQVREDTSGPSYYKSYKTVGGAAVKFASTQRVMCTRIKRIKVGDGDPTGYVVKCQTDKNRIAAPHQMTEWVLDFVRGPSVELTLCHVLKAHKLLTHKKGTSNWMLWDGTETTGGSEGFADWCTPARVQKCSRKLREVLRAH